MVKQRGLSRKEEICTAERILRYNLLVQQKLFRLVWLEETAQRKLW
jgi:hypothetical protein